MLWPFSKLIIQQCFIKKHRSSFIEIFTTTINHLPPTSWQTLDSIPVELDWLRVKKCSQPRFDLIVISEYFLAKLAVQSTEEVVVSWRQVRATRRMGENFPAQIQQLL